MNKLELVKYLKNQNINIEGFIKLDKNTRYQIQTIENSPSDIIQILWLIEKKLDGYHVNKYGSDIFKQS